MQIIVKKKMEAKKKRRITTGFIPCNLLVFVVIEKPKFKSFEVELYSEIKPYVSPRACGNSGNQYRLSQIACQTYHIYLLRREYLRT